MDTPTVAPGSDPYSEYTPYTRDEKDLAHFGKRQQLRRNFRLLSIFGMTAILMITWEGLLATFQSGFSNGGPTGLVWGFIFTWAGVLVQSLVMAEMGSMIPLAGGEYNWVAILAPKSSAVFLSYITGWLTVIAWQAGTASATFFISTMAQGLVVLNYPTYEPQRWQATLIFYLVIGFIWLINTRLGLYLPKLQVAVLIVHLVGFLAVLIPLVYLAPKGKPADVFQTFVNEGGWPSDGLSFFIGTIGIMFSFIGNDAATHMAEEIEDAAVVIPKAMILSVILNGTLGFGMLIATLFCLGDINSVVHTPTRYPFMQIFYNATNSTGGATAMICLCYIAVFFCTVGITTTASRMVWAFAREKGIPGSTYFARVDPQTALPLWSIGFTCVISLLLALINIGSTTVFNALTGLTVAGFYTSFIIAASVMLHKRLTTPDSEFRWGPFKLGRAGIPLLIISICYSIIGVFFSFWPPVHDPTPQTMNWSVVVFLGVLALSIVHWFMYARHVYTGPIIEIERPTVNSQEKTS